MTKVLMKGNEALAEAAIRAGCRSYFGYPITPQSEVPEYFARKLPDVGGVFLQAESEIASIYMLYGAAAAGHRTMTSSSGPGISLMQEGISSAAGSDLPMVIVNMMRGGPGLGSIQPSQTDYFQTTRGGGNGDYRVLAYAPSNVQELVDYTMLAFEKADEWRMPAFIMSDGMLGQMMEPVEFPESNKEVLNRQANEWTTDGRRDERGHRNVITSLELSTPELEKINRKRYEKYQQVMEKEVIFEEDGVKDCELLITAYGSAARIVKTAIQILRENGYKVGLIRPISVWPFPYEAYKDVPCDDILVVELNNGQMLDDVKIATEGRQNIHFYNRLGGMVPTAQEIVDKAIEILGGKND